MISTLRIVVFALLLLPAATSVDAGDAATDWPRWRGPRDSGSIDTGRYPSTLTDGNEMWKVELPGKGCSTPVVRDDVIYITAPVDGRDALLAYDLSGSELWRATFGSENAGKHRNGSGCNASPAADASGVYVYFKSGTLAAVNTDGSVRWQTNLVERFGRDTLYWDHGTSPVLTENDVVMARMHHGESWLAAFDKESGDMTWKVARNFETPQEGDHGYATPLVMPAPAGGSILVWGAQHLTAHHASTGAVQWTCGNFNPDSERLWPSISTPVVVNETAVIAFGRNDRGKPRLHGVRVNGSGDVTETNHIWKRTDIGTFVPSPVAWRGRVYLLRDKGEVVCINPATGDTVWEGAMPKHRAKYYASPLIAAGRLYAPREDGVVFVADIRRDELQLLSENDMGESVIGSPVPAANSILLRGEKHLFRLGEPQDQLTTAGDQN